MQGSFGPFVAEVPIEVPLWIALNLKLKEKCNIICPHWLTANSLQNYIALERPSANDDEDTSTDIRSTLPYHYAEIGFLILHYAPDNVPDLDTVRDRLNELQTLRNTKIEVRNYLYNKRDLLFFFSLPRAYVFKCKLSCSDFPRLIRLLTLFWIHYAANHVPSFESC